MLVVMATTATERSHPDGDSPIAANVTGVPEVSSSADALSLYQADPGKGTRCYGAIAHPAVGMSVNSPNRRVDRQVATALPRSSPDPSAGGAALRWFITPYRSARQLYSQIRSDRVMPLAPGTGNLLEMYRYV